ncbi:MAG: hypothetical protein GXP53_11000 [Deltaproteobacteria bacterium]|nr:hypothetical protein [Deltaproteobacteria bacterium]
MKIFKRLNFFDRLMAAISFAEAGEHKTAMKFMEADTGKQKRRQKQKNARVRQDQRPAMRM